MVRRQPRALFKMIEIAGARKRSGVRIPPAALFYLVLIE